MEHASLFLGKFRNLVPIDDALKGLLVSIIKEETGVELEKEALVVGRWEVRVQAPAAAKSEIYLHREKIMESLERHLGRRGLKGIM